MRFRHLPPHLPPAALPHCRKAARARSSHTAAKQRVRTQATLLQNSATAAVTLRDSRGRQIITEARVSDRTAEEESGFNALGVHFSQIALKSFETL